MTLSDFLESLFSRLVKWASASGASDPPLTGPIVGLGQKTSVVALLDRAPLFVLGSWDEIVASIMEFRADLVEDQADGLMMPFPSIAVAFEGKRGWSLDWIHRLDGDRYVHTLFHATQETAWFRNAIEFEFQGKRDGEFLIQLAPESVRRFASVDARAPELVTQYMGRIVEDALLRIALISPPDNYIVDRTPILASREEKRVARGEPTPLRKRPHFIVIDHEGLVELNLKTR